MKWSLALLALAALLPCGASAADGAICDTTGRQKNSFIGLQCHLVCDSKTSASTTCSDFTLETAADTYLIEIASDTGCSAAAELDVSHKGDSSSDSHELAELIRGGDTAVTIDGAAAHPLTVLTFALSSMTDCTDFDVKLWRFHEKKQ